MNKFLDLTGLSHFKEKTLEAVDDKIEQHASKVVTNNQIDTLFNDYTSPTGGVNSSTGYRVFGDGFIEQWGKALVASGDGTRIIFPVAFPSAIESIVCSAAGNIGVPCAAQPDGLGAATIVHTANGGMEVYWFAVGN